MYYTSKTEYQCFNARGLRTGSTTDMWQATTLAGERGTIVQEHSVGESVWTVRDGVAQRTR